MQRHDKHEQECLVEAVGLPKGDFTFINAAKESISHINSSDYNGIILGASGDCSIVSDDAARLETLTSFVKTARKNHVPMFGINYGAHILTVAFNGKVVHDPEHRGLGTLEVHKTQQADRDPIFGMLPDVFSAISGHNDHIISLPEGAESLLEGDMSKYECWTIPGEAIYATELQVDLNKDRMTERLVYYRDKYANQPGELAHYVLKLKPTPEASRILPLFIQKVVEGNLATS